MGKELILIVEDNRSIASLIANQYLPSLGYNARVAHTATKAIEILSSSDVSLMLLDFELPDMNGLELLQKVSSREPKTPAILMTAYGSEQIAVEAFRLGVEDYLIKPIELKMLDLAIQRALAVTRLRRETGRLNAQLKEQVSWLTVLSKVGQSITSTLELDQVLQRIVEGSVYLTRAEEGFLAIPDENNQQLYLRAVKNIDKDVVRTMRLPIEDSLLGRVMLTGASVRTTNKSTDPLLKVSTGFLVKSLLYVPILAKGKVIGVLAVDNQRSLREFTQNDEMILTYMADYAAVALENANLYTQAQQEIIERKRIEQELRKSEERYELAIRGANDGIWDWDLKTNKVYYATRWKSILGLQEEQVGDSPQEWIDRVHPDDVEKLQIDIAAHLKGSTPQFENELRMLQKGGSYRWVLCRGLAVRDSEGVATRMAGSLSDTHDRKVAEAKLIHDAFYDRLTGLPNRALFMDRLQNAIQRSKRRKDYLFAVLFLDLDRFKDINDSLGHMVGDQLLISVGTLLKKNLRSADTIARLSGDEFVILLEDIRDFQASATIADTIIQRLSLPIRLDDAEVYISTSIGIVLNSDTYNRPEEMLRDADIAMYIAKERGRSRYELFNPEMREKIIKRLALEADLRQALERKELQLHYQPIVSLKTGAWIGLEALVRWNHPHRGLVQPDEFLSVAIETGLILPLDWWVFHEACRQMQEWHARFHINPALTISINLTTKHLVQPDFLKRVEEILVETGIDRNALKLEITENTVLENNEITKDVLAGLKELGIQFHIDDFGTGYSSLGYLHQFPVNALKIDRAFINQISEDGSNSEIVKTIISLAHDMGIETIAEGVETESQIELLQALQCEYAQGFFLSRPMNSHSIELLLDKLQSSGVDGQAQVELSTVAVSR